MSLLSRMCVCVCGMVWCGWIINLMNNFYFIIFVHFKRVNVESKKLSILGCVQSKQTHTHIFPFLQRNAACLCWTHLGSEASIFH
jgi:hypothetical protein